MKKISTMGELLIDFVPVLNNNNHVYEQKAGGAPANVAATVAILGGDSTFYGQVGDDIFGHFLISELSHFGVNTSHIRTTKDAKTGLAFVHLDEEGNRSFHFYRNPSADMLYSKDDYENDSALEDIFAFSSVSLIDYPIKDAHLAAIQKIKQNNGYLVFDTNIRLHLWKDHAQYRQLIFDFIRLVDIVKIADDEIGWLTNADTVEEGVKILLETGIEMLLLTRGKKGATIFTNGIEVSHPGYSVDTVDTTGAGDAFLGAFLYQLSTLDQSIKHLNVDVLEELLAFSNAVAAISTTKKGALSAIPTRQIVSHFRDNQLSR